MFRYVVEDLMCWRLWTLTTMMIYSQLYYNACCTIVNKGTLLLDNTQLETCFTKGHVSAYSNTIAHSLKTLLKISSVFNDIFQIKIKELNEILVSQQLSGISLLFQCISCALTDRLRSRVRRMFVCVSRVWLWKQTYITDLRRQLPPHYFPTPRVYIRAVLSDDKVRSLVSVWHPVI
jgi:hypothetical protein